MQKQFNFTYILANIWHAFDVDENIDTPKFLAQIFVNEINTNYSTIVSQASAHVPHFKGSM